MENYTGNLCYDFIHGLRIYCTNIAEVVEMTNLLVDVGVPHGSSGYSKRFMDMRTAPRDASWNTLYYSGRGIEYAVESISAIIGERVTKLDTHLTFTEVMSRYAGADADCVCDADALESFLAG